VASRADLGALVHDACEVPQGAIERPAGIVAGAQRAELRPVSDDLPAGGDGAGKLDQVTSK
jgi:hypothetical protein